MDNYVINTIRICIKASKYSFGETMLYDIKSKKVFVVVIANDAGNANKKKVIDKCNCFKIPYFVLMSKSELMSIFNRNISSFGITDVNLAQKLINNIRKGGIDYGNK